MKSQTNERTTLFIQTKWKTTTIGNQLFFQAFRNFSLKLLHIYKYIYVRKWRNENLNMKLEKVLVYIFDVLCQCLTENFISKPPQRLSSPSFFSPLQNVEAKKKFWLTVSKGCLERVAFQVELSPTGNRGLMQDYLHFEIDLKICIYSHPNLTQYSKHMWNK